VWYLRRLLTKIPGPKSFQDLRTVNEVVHFTFQAACVTRGFVENDGDWTACFCEAVIFALGSQLRSLFVAALIWGPLAEPLNLWLEYRVWMCDDLQRRLESLQYPRDLPLPECDYGLYLIAELLQHHNKTLLDFGLPEPEFQWSEATGNPLIAAELNYNPEIQQTEFDASFGRLNQDQRHAFNIITAAIENDPQHAQFFLQGPGGTGKTFFYRCLCQYFRAQAKIVLCVASSGIAALLLPGGTTAHSRFKIPLKLDSNSMCSISKTSNLGKLIRRITLIIWDEAPMTHRLAFETVDRTLRDI
jgi:hypothetical protein